MVDYKIKINGEVLIHVNVWFNPTPIPRIVVSNISKQQADSLGLNPPDPECIYDIELKAPNSDVLTMNGISDSMTCEFGDGNCPVTFTISFNVTGDIALGGDNYKAEDVPECDHCPTCGAEL